MQRLDKPRIVGVVAECGAQPLDRGVQAVLEIDEGPRGPQTLAQLLPRHDVAGPLEHDRENLERLILQPDADAALAQLARAQIDFECSESPDVDDRRSSGSIGIEKFTSPRRAFAPFHQNVKVA